MSDAIQAPDFVTVLVVLLVLALVVPSSSARAPTWQSSRGRSSGFTLFAAGRAGFAQDNLPCDTHLRDAATRLNSTASALIAKNDHTHPHAAPVADPARHIS